MEDLISRIEDKFGRENLYKLIFAGKLLREEDPLSKYKLKSKIPIIVMITHSPNIIIENSKEDKQGANEGKEFSLLEIKEVNLCIFREHQQQQKRISGARLLQEGEDSH